MKLRTAAVALTALALPLTACSNADDEKAAEAVSASLQDDEDGIGLAKKDADCVGEDMVDELGRDKLVEYKIITEDFKADDAEAGDMSQEDAEATADIIGECADVKQVVVDALSEQEIPEETMSCIEDKLSDDVLKDFLVAGFTGDDEESGKVLEEAAGECV